MIYIGAFGLLGEAIVFWLFRQSKIARYRDHQPYPTVKFVVGHLGRLLFVDDTLVRKGLEHKHGGRNQWLFIAEVVERFNLLAYCAAISLTPAVMFTWIPTDKAL